MVEGFYSFLSGDPAEGVQHAPVARGHHLPIHSAALYLQASLGRVYGEGACEQKHNVRGQLCYGTITTESL